MIRKFTTILVMFAWVGIAIGQLADIHTISMLPFSKLWLFDYNGDGKLDALNTESTYQGYDFNTGNDLYNHTLKIFEPQSNEITSYVLPFTHRIDDFQKLILDIGKFSNYDALEMIFKGDYGFYSSVEANTSILQFNQDASVSNKLIKTAAFDGEFEFPSLVLDADNDGRTDLYGYNTATKQHYFLIQQTDGSFMRKPIRILTDDEEIDNAIIAKEDAPIVAPVPVRFTGVSLAKVIRKQLMKNDGAQRTSQAANVEIAWSENVSYLDLNMDGYPDLIDNKNGGALISIDDGVYYFGTFKGIPTARDLNGDGFLDFILFDTKTKTVSLQMYTGSGGFKEQVLMQNMNISDVYCFDFDGDGDVDILLPFDYTDTSQYAFLVFFQNNGDNTFTKKERSFNEKLYFIDCIDIDNDGVYDVIAVQKDTEPGGQNHQLYRIRCLASSGWKVEKDDTAFCENVKANVGWDDSWISFEWMAGDFMNEGKTNFYTQQYLSYEVLNVAGVFNTSSINQAPSQMSKPTVIADPESQLLRIEWELGNDDLTASVDLSYELRIGTAPGQADVLYAYANADGSRTKLSLGNCGSACFRLIHTDSWEAKDYFIAVQAIDAHGRGGAWSDELVYQHRHLSSDFNIGLTKTTTTDTLTLCLKAPKNENYQYEWDLGAEGEFISEQNGCWRILYNSAGLKKIILKVTDEVSKQTAMSEKQIEVFAVKFEYNQQELDYRNDMNYFDANMDGKIDVLSGTNYSSTGGAFGLLEGNGKGKFTKVGRTYNSDLKPIFTSFIDYNMDGLPDFIGKTNKANLFINGDDFDFEYSNEIFTAIDNKGNNIFNNTNVFSNLPWADINNDGYQDFIYPLSGMYINSGDNKNYTRIDFFDQDEIRECWFVDFNRDGLLDVLGLTNYSKFNIYLNNGNNQFTKKATPLVNYTWGPNINPVADYNNDGFWDIVSINSDSKIIQIYLGDISHTYQADPIVISLPMKKDAWISGDIQFQDFDNNGYPDLGFYNGILYFYPNFETKWQEIADTHLGNLQELPSNESHLFYPFVDLNGDGVPDAKAYNIFSRILNTPPHTPLHVRATQSDEGILLIWDDALDAETPVTQMRYNISLKEKGMSGNNSFIISPMNGLRNEATIIPRYSGYKAATRMTVPLSRFQVGKTYQLQVQSIDMWNEHSPFSPIYEFTVESQINIRMPQTACMGNSVSVNYTGTETGTISWDWDGGEATEAGNNNWNVLWNTPGVKNVKASINSNIITRAIHVRDDIDLTFTLPGTVLANCEIPFKLPALFNDPSKKIYFRTSDNNQQSEADNVSSSLISLANQNQKILIYRRLGTLDAIVVFPKNELQWIEIVYNDEDCGEVVYRQEVDVVGANFTPQIALVTVDAVTGKNKINWALPTDIDTDIFNKIEIYKEMGGTNNFVKIDEMPISATMYIDQSSDPFVRKSRYRIAVGTTFGGHSQLSTTHSNVHVMINKGLGNTINLVWSQYEGAIIDCYTILRGNSPDNLQVLTTASGYENSFTDMNPPEDAYYALAYSAAYSDKWISLSQQQSNMQHTKVSVSNIISGTSNIVTNNQSVVLNFAQTISIQCVEKVMELTPEQSTLHFFAEILPAMATYKRVNWQIVSGNHLATINENGLLVYTGNGDNGLLKIRATTIDGSNIFVEETINVCGFIYGSIESIETQAIKNITIYPNPVKDRFAIKNLNKQALVQIYDYTGVLRYHTQITEDFEIDVQQFKPGVYIFRCQSGQEVISLKFMKE